MAFADTVRYRYQTDLEAIKAAGLFKGERYIHSPQSSEIEVEFPIGSAVRKCINICANNYLGLSSHPEVIAAAHAGLDARGYGMSSVRFICGTQDIHRELENRLTAFLGTEDTLLFPSCMDANAGFFEACLNEQDVMIADRLVHASIVDGMRLCKATQDTYKHSDMGHLEEKLQEHQDKRSRMVITDGVFSMDGDTVKLADIVALAEKYNAMVFVDDSHATGFMGKTWVALPEGASAGAANWWRCAASAHVLICFPTPWRR
ncbi:MAG: aminotransferase class I/II-fold pyridoxal phosphate-dependent enzyme [Terriglobales bacterium]